MYQSLTGRSTVFEATPEISCSKARCVNGTGTRLKTKHTEATTRTSIRPCELSPDELFALAAKIGVQPDEYHLYPVAKELATAPLPEGYITFVREDDGVLIYADER